MSEKLSEEDEKIGKPSIFNILINPKDEFKKIKLHPTSFIAILIVTAITLIGTLLIYYSSDTSLEFAEELSEQEEQIASIIGMGIVFVGGLLGPIIAITLASLVYFLVAKMIQSTVS